MTENDALVNAFTQLMELLREYRDPNHGDAWTRAQTFQSLWPQTLEEVYELRESMGEDDWDALRSELSDLIYHVAFYAQIAAEKNKFNLADIAITAVEKHHARMPKKEERRELTPEEVNHFWQQKKLASLAIKNNLFHDIPMNMANLIRAEKLQRRALLIGFDWPDYKGALAKVKEEIAELEAELDAAYGDNSNLENTSTALPASQQHKIRHELGDCFFSLINLTRHLQENSEEVLFEANQRFIKRLNSLLVLAKERDLDLQSLSLEVLESLWQEAKKTAHT